MTACKMQSVPTRPPGTLVRQTLNCFPVLLHAVSGVYSTSTQILLLACYREISPAYSLNPGNRNMFERTCKRWEKKTPHPQAGLEACCSRKWCKWFPFRQTHSVQHEQAEAIHSALWDCPARHIPAVEPCPPVSNKEQWIALRSHTHKWVNEVMLFFGLVSLLQEEFQHFELKVKNI